MNPNALRGIICIGLAKLLFKLVEKQFTVNDPENFQPYETSNASNSQGVCIFRDKVLENSENSMSVTEWINTSRFLLPVLGGLLSTHPWFGYVRVIQIGGVVMLLSSVLMSVSVYYGLMCRPSSGIIIVTWLLLPMFFGLIEPNTMSGMFSWSTESRFCTSVAALYCAITSTGEWLGLLFRCINEQRNAETFLRTVPCFVMIGISFLIPKVTRESASRANRCCDFAIPTRLRMIRYFRIFCSLILFLISVNDTRSAVYESELRHFLNVTDLEPLTLYGYNWLSPEVLHQISRTFFALLLLSFSCASSRELPIQFRIQAGILLEAGISLSFMIFTAVYYASDKAMLLAIYSIASVLDGLAEILVMVASYELGNRIAPKDSKAFVLGIMFTVWGLSNIISGLLLEALHLIGKKNFFFIYHLSVCAALIVSWIYNRFQAFPLAVRIIPVEELEEQPSLQVMAVRCKASSDDRTPLLSSTTRI